MTTNFAQMFSKSFILFRVFFCTESAINYRTFSRRLQTESQRDCWSPGGFPEPQLSRLAPGVWCSQSPVQARNTGTSSQWVVRPGVGPRREAVSGSSQGRRPAGGWPKFMESNALLLASSGFSQQCCIATSKLQRDQVSRSCIFSLGQKEEW